MVSPSWAVLISALASSAAAAALLPADSLFENDQCGKDGVCKKATECPSAMALLKEGKKPDLCSFDHLDQPIVCCPETNVEYKTEESVSAAMCQKYTKSLCPGFHYSILEGSAAKPKELPFMALIGYGSDKDNVEWQCGGSLISKRYVLSAAHCTSLSSLGKPRWVRLGELDIKDTTEDAKPQDFRITEHHNHPDYNVSLQYSDITLYQLDRDVVFDDYVRPVCLGQVHASDEGTATAAGWGRTDPVEPKSTKLLKVDLDLFPLNNCSGLVNPTQLPRGLSEDMICSGKLEGGKDTCQGDSGGPLFLPVTSEQQKEGCYLYTQIGITSFGKSCGLAGFPAVYTDVASFLPWLERIVWPKTNGSAQSIWN